MKALVQNAYGSNARDVLELREIDAPVVGDGEVLVRVRAASLHAGDYFTMAGSPYVARFVAGWPRPKKNYVVGLSVAGIVEAAGGNVTRFQPGDEVFGEATGACAEYLVAAEDRFAEKPAGLTFEQAAAIPTSGLAALQGLRDAAKVQPGQKVLINGASGGVGTFAVQIATAMGAEVTGVCSTGNVELVRSIGADHVIDYTLEDFTAGTERYDVILDNVANRSFSELRRALAPEGVIVPNSGHGGLSYIFKAFVGSVFVRQIGAPLVSSSKPEDLTALKELAESGKVTPFIDRAYPLDEGVEAFRYVSAGHARGKVVVTV